MKESEIQQDILDYLNLLPLGKPLRLSCNRIGGKPGEQFLKKATIYTPKGVSDITFFHKKHCFAIEVKTEKEFKALSKKIDKLRNSIPKSKKDIHIKDQITYLDDINRTGNCGFFTYSLEHTLKKMKNFLLEIVCDSEKLI